MNTDEIDALRKSNKETSFQNWLENDIVRVITSQIPGGAGDGVLLALLKSAYTAGHDAGEGLVLIELLKTVVKDPKQFRP